MLKINFLRGLCATIGFAFSVSFSALASEDSARGKFQAKFWATPRAGSQYPEMMAGTMPVKPSFGIAFQGGGNRAAPAALGQLRELHTMKWIDQVDYISAISGGSWTAIPYTFLKLTCEESKGFHCQEKKFLGVTQPPSEIVRILPELDKHQFDRRDFDDFQPGSMLHAIEKSAISHRVVSAWAKGKFDESYAEALGEIYLEPFGLGRNDQTAPDSLFTWRREDRERIKKIPRFSNTEIHYVERKRPYLIVGGTVLTRRTLINPERKFRMEMTPLYTGVPDALTAKAHPQIQLGGGFVESFGFDYITDEGLNKEGKITLRDPLAGNRSNRSRLNFSLSNVAAVSGAAPVEFTVTRRFLRFLASNFGFPEHYVPGAQRTDRQWRILAEPNETYETEWAHADGGHEDNMGLAPLLARRVKNILVFANAVKPLNVKAFNSCLEVISTLPMDTKIDAQLIKRTKNCEKMAGDDIASFFVRTKNHIHNVGLKRLNEAVPAGQEKFRSYYDLLKTVGELIGGRTQGISKKQMPVDDFHGLSCAHYEYVPSSDATPAKSTQGYTPKICFLYLSFDREWVNILKQEAEKMEPTSRQLRSIRKTLDLDRNWMTSSRSNRGSVSHGFPHLATFWDKPGFLIDTAPARLYALSNFTSWKLRKHQNEIADAFGLHGLKLRK